MKTESRRDFVRNLSATGLVLAAFSATQARSQTAPQAQPLPGVFNVIDFGAKGDGISKDTAAIQAAVDACCRAGGGLVHFPTGNFLSGTIRLKDNVTLFFSPSAVLLGSVDAKDYLAMPFPARDLDVGGFEIWALIHAEGCRNMGIEGNGTINGNGSPFGPAKHEPDVAGKVRPRAVFLKNCREFRLRNITIQESAMWSVHLALCEKVFIEGVSIYSSLFVNQDGIVLDSCREALVSNCFVNTFDDAILIKSSFPQPCINLTITNCILTTRCTAIKFGTQSLGGFGNVSISNCAFYDCGLGGLKFLTVDGGDLQDVVVSNITMANVSAPIFFRIGNRGQDFGFKEVEKPRPVGRIKNVLISEIRATISNLEHWPGRKESMRAGTTMGIAGLPGHPVEEVVLENIRVTYPGGGTLEEAQRTDIPEQERSYPENTAFGVLPAYGLYLRHVRGVTLRNVRLDLAKPDFRSALICDDVENLDVIGFNAPVCGSEPLLQLKQTRGATIRDSSPRGTVETFVRIDGAQSDNIALISNDLRRAHSSAVEANGATTPITMVGNLAS